MGNLSEGLGLSSLEFKTWDFVRIEKLSPVTKRLKTS